MSTKTTFKRIALVAVAALGLGVMSVAPSQAVITGLTVTVANGTATQTVSDSTTAATINVSALVDGNLDTVTVGFIQKSIPSTAIAASRPTLGLVETNTASGSLVYSGGINGTAEGQNTGANVWGGLGDSVTIGAGTSNGYALSRAAGSVGYTGAKFILQLDSVTAPTAGTYTYTIITKTYSYNPSGSGSYTITTNTADVSIVVAAAAAASTTASTATSFARLNLTSNVDAAGTDAVISALATASSTPVGYLEVGVRNALNAVAVAEDSVTVTITGAGILKSGSVTGSSFKVAATGDVEFEVLPDGRAGVASIVVATNGTTYPAKTVTFYAATASTAVASVGKAVIEATGSATGDTVRVAIKDANGAVWAGAAYIYASSAADALIAGSETPVLCTFDTGTDQRHECDVTGKTVGTAKFKVIDASTVAAAKWTSNEVSVRVATAVPASVKLVFDKASYQPGEKAVLSVVPLDAAGAQMVGKTYANLLATGGITSNIAFSTGSDTLTATDIVVSATSSSTSGTTAGQRNYTVYMPFASGDVVVTATGGTALPAAGRVAVTATASVVNSSVDAATDAANEATDAANAATDAALAAADAADAATAAAQDASDAVAALSASVSKLISSLRAQITSLTNLVIKIQKKVRA
jgi:trimeric autotransporter adhesin